MSAIPKDNATLEQDAVFDEPLRRVAFEAGMMLGLEATRDEQDYHRRRLTRHQYWLHGMGTIAGMAVSIDPATSEDPDRDMSVRILVGAGIGIDGLGREILVHEKYCVSLNDWLAAQDQTTLLDAYDEQEDLLWLRVSVRYKDCPVAAQPVLARKLNLGVDPVQPSRTADSVLLEMHAELPSGEEPYRPWGVHRSIGEALPEGLTGADRAYVDGAASGRPKQVASLHAQLLHALDVSGLQAAVSADRLAESARLLLARISIKATSLDALIVNPAHIAVNNLVRPFVTTASQLAYLASQS